MHAEANAGVCLLSKNEIPGQMPSVSLTEKCSIKETSAACLVERLKAENDALNRIISKQSQELKIANDRVCQLQDTNIYRREVTRLEGVVNEY